MPSIVFCGRSSVGRAQPCQGWGRVFKSRRPLSLLNDRGSFSFTCFPGETGRHVGFRNQCFWHEGSSPSESKKSFPSNYGHLHKSHQETRIRIFYVLFDVFVITVPKSLFFYRIFYSQKRIRYKKLFYKRSFYE